MDAQQKERRFLPDRHKTEAPSTSEIVRESLLMQQQFGTVCAIEYLKSNTVDVTVVHRVLAQRIVRADDKKLIQEARRSDSD